MNTALTCPIRIPIQINIFLLHYFLLCIKKHSGIVIGIAPRPFLDHLYQFMTEFYTHPKSYNEGLMLDNHCPV
jgi:hypothetical protein